MIHSVKDNDESESNLERQHDFMRLIEAKAHNQNHKQVQANGEFLLQLAQFASNDGLANVQNTLHKLVSSLQSNQALQASALVGRKVLVWSKCLNLANKGDVTIAIDMPVGVRNLSASIFSESGEIVKTISLGQPEPGFFQFVWDGTDHNKSRLPAVIYKIEVCGISEGKEVRLKTMTSANVDSVSLGNNGQGLKLNISGLGSVLLDEVRHITV